MKQTENKIQVHNDCVSLRDSNTLQTMKQMEYKMQVHISLNWTLREVGEYYTLSYKTKQYIRIMKFQFFRVLVVNALYGLYAIVF